MEIDVNKVGLTTLLLSAVIVFLVSSEVPAATEAGEFPPESEIWIMNSDGSVQTAGPQRPARRKMSRERVLCESMTSAIRSLKVDDDSLSRMVIVDQIECLQSTGSSASTSSQKMCSFRREYQQRYWLRNEAGEKFYDAFISYFDGSPSGQAAFAIAGVIVVGDQACGAR